jgi:hypothetical protein
VHQRTALLSRTDVALQQYNLGHLWGGIQTKRGRAEALLHIEHSLLRQRVECAMDLVEVYDQRIRDLEDTVLAQAHQQYAVELPLLLQSKRSGIGSVFFASDGDAALLSVLTDRAEQEAAGCRHFLP